MPQKSYYQQRQDEARLLIEAAKIKNNLTTAQLAKKIGMPFNTLNKLVCHPGRLRLEYIWAIEKLAGRE